MSYDPYAASSFSKKSLRITFRVEDGSLGPKAEQDTLVLTGHRCQVDISNGGQSTGAQALISIEGMRRKDMDRLSMVGGFVTDTHSTISRISSSTVKVEALDEQSAPATIFFGQIMEGYADLQQAPNTTFRVKAYTNTIYSAQKILPLSYPGKIPAESVLSDICAQSGLRLQAHNFTGVFDQGYYSYGTTLDQIDKIVSAFQGSYVIADGTILRVWGKNYVKNDSDLPEISPENGLIGYPQYSNIGVKFQTLFRSDITYWTPFSLQSSYVPAGWEVDGQGKNQAGQQVGLRPFYNGIWLATLINHSLSAEMPGGPWLTEIEAIRPEGTSHYGIANR